MRRGALLAASAALALAAPAQALAAPPVVGGTSFNDAAPLGSGANADALDTGSAVFYRFHVPRGPIPSATVSLDMSALDPSTTGAANLIVRMYDPLRQQLQEAQNLGPGDPTTHIKTVTLSGPAATAAGTYYISVTVNDFLPAGAAPTALPLTVSYGLAVPQRSDVSGVDKGPAEGVSWAVFAALCLAGVAIGTAGGLLTRRAASARQ